MQNRAGQTAAVIKKFIPALKVGNSGAAELLALSGALDGLAQGRDTALAAFDAANNAESQGFLTLRRLVLGLPQAASGELDEEVPAEGALESLLDAAYAVVPRTTELAIERGQKLASALEKIDAFLTAQIPPRGPITSGGKGRAELLAAIAAQPGLEQTMEDAAAGVSAARNSLAQGARGLDRLNKRFYEKLQSEARDNAALSEGLGQIDTETDNLPETLGIRSLLQGGDDGLHLLVGYDNGTGGGATTKTLEWQVAGVDADFTHSVPVDASGNALGPFKVGQTIQIRTRAANANGARTSSVRTFTITKPTV
ncbi:MAG: hypothetical protein WCF18_03215 [Chthoniobacteraceae bacterium]